MYARLQASESADRNCYGHTNTLLNLELKTLGKKMVDKITQLPYDAVAHTVAELEDGTVSDNSGACETRGTTSCDKA